MTTIDTNMSLVMIDPNEPLELYDGTIIKGRLEWFLYALCCLDYGNLPTPLSRIEEWANALITNELPNMEPQSRAEEFFKAILTGDTSNLPTPQSRSEVLLDKLARGENDFTNVEKIQSRYEFLLAYLIKNGGGIGNIDYVLYKFQKEDETLYNTKERPVKSAILKGNTLVNLLSTKYAYCNLPTSEEVEMDSSVNIYDANNNRVKQINLNQNLEANKKYLIVLNITQLENGKRIAGLSRTTSDEDVYDIPNFNSVGLKYVKYTPKSDVKQVSFYIDFNNENPSIAKMKQPMIIEYQQGMENWNIPYFEGMQSVRMPVLTTTGKNLFDGKYHVYKYVDTENGILRDSSDSHATDFILIRGFESISCSNEGYEAFAFYNENKIFIMGGFGKQLEVPKNAYYVRFTIKPTDNLAKFMVVEGSLLPPYEPYKTNILSCNEEIILRGIGEVKDTLDGNTGELTQRIGEIVLDGSAGWTEYNGNYYLSLPGVQAGEKLPWGKPTILSNLYPPFIGVETDVYIASGWNGNQIKIRDVNLSLEGLKSKLMTQPLVATYISSEESVKTVDLSIVDQGGATIPKLKTFDKITHVNVSATDILPGEVEMEVATTVGEDLSGTLYSTMEDIETKQEALKESNNAQTESVNSTMMATTEIYESLL